MNISFDLHLLGWKAFEDLSASIFRDILGQTLQVFAPGADGGRDASFFGVWAGENKSDLRTGSFCIQCKHTSKPSQNLSISTIERELKKVSRLAAEGLCDNYFLITNHGLPAGVAEEAEKKIVAAGAKTACIFGSEWIAKLISENPRLRRLVPRIYGLGDLTQIITHQAYRQARTVLDSIAPDLACFVPTGAYRQCAAALQQHGFVILLGEPASGKTMIANLMALSAADEWNIETLMISRPADFSNLWNPDDPGQFLWVDDAFGATQYDANRAREWNQLLPKLKAAINVGARVVFTSRDYIFSAAKQDLKIGSFELFEDSRVVIHVERLTDGEREMILYSHLKAGSQPIKFKSAVKEFLQDAVTVPKFLPEIARRFGNPKFTKNLQTTSAGVKEFFEKPVKVLYDVIASLAAAEKAAIGLVFIAGGKLPIPIAADQNVVGTLELLGVTLGEVKAALVSLDDSLLRKQKDGAAEFWVFRHPTIRDAYAKLVGGNPELVDVYLAGVDTEQLLSEVICGNVAIEGATIVVPPSRYALILQRLNGYKRPGSVWSDPVEAFLSTRCAADFVAEYYKDKDLTACIPRATWNFGYFGSGLKILSKFNAEGLLPKSIRDLTANKIIEISEKDYSCRFANSPGVRGILTASEIDETVSKIGNSVLKGGREIIEKIKYDWDRETDPNDSYRDISDTLELIEGDERFSENDWEAAAALRQVIDETIAELDDEIKRPEYEKLETAKAVESEAPKGRSVFDDVDQ